MNDINPGAVLADIGKGLIIDFVKTTTRRASGTLRHLYEEHIHRFEEYLQKTQNHVTSIRTILTRDRSTHVDNIYVSIDFRSQDVQYSDDELIDRIRGGEKLVINGTGGSGKTVFLKNLWYHFLKNPEGRIPIYFELRHLNDMSDVPLDTTLFHHITNYREQCPQSVFNSMCQSGGFILILDGFDEIKESRQGDIAKRILDFSAKYPEIPICVSSRPDDRFLSWQTFGTYHVMPLSFEQVRRLIKIVEFQSNSKEEFLRRLDETFYEKHKSFLSIPLLASIMLLTFDHYAEVPADLHLFYEHAFTALFYYHDSFKDSFSRERRSHLTIDKFKKIFSLFCLFTYSKETYEFNDDSIRRDIKAAISAERADVDIEAFIFDITQAVCLLQKDGLSYTFSHRSFQEYFSAYAICFVLQDRSARVMEKIFARHDDRCLAMSYRMNRDVIQRNYILPLIERSGLDEDFITRSDDEILRYLRVEVRCMVSMHGKKQWFSGYSLVEGVDFVKLHQTLRDTVGVENLTSSRENNKDLYIDILIPFLRKYQGYDPADLTPATGTTLIVSILPEEPPIDKASSFTKILIKSAEDARKTVLRSDIIPNAFRQIFAWRDQVAAEQQSADSAIESLFD